LDQAIRDKVLQVLDQQVRPRLEMDGGGIELVSIEDDGTVKVRLTGGCHGCPMAGLTMAMAVERTLKAAIPEVKQVVPAD
jgi:Fe-S cluster biogenesis protein NfuA